MSFRLRLTIILAIVAPAAVVLGQLQIRAGLRQDSQQTTQVVLEESRQAGELLDRFQQAIDSGIYDVAATAAVELSALGPEKLVPGTMLGARSELRRRIYALSQEQRQGLALAMADAAGAALAKAEWEGGSDEALMGVYLAYPGSDAGRAALAHLWARAMEQGRLELAADWLDLYTQDTLLPMAERARGLTLLGFCGSVLGRGDIVDHALAALPELPDGFTFTWAGVSLNPGETLARLRQELKAPPVMLVPTGIASNGAFRRIEWPKDAANTILQEQSSGSAWMDEPTLQSRVELLRMRSESFDKGLGSAVASDGQLFVADATHLTASDLHSGRQLWKRELTSQSPPLQPGVMSQARNSAEQWIVRAGGQLLVAWSGSNRGSPASHLMAVDATSGETLWQWRTSTESSDADPKPPGTGPQAPSAPAVPRAPVADNIALYPTGVPTVYGDRVYVVAINNMPNWQPTPVDAYLVCLDLASGRRLWACFLGSDVPTNDVGGWSTMLAAPVSDGRRIYVNSGVHSLAAVDQRTGEIVWVREFVPGAAAGTNPFRMPGQQVATVRPVPVLVGESLLVSSGRDGQLWSLATSTGEIQWQVNEPLALISGIHDGHVVMSDIGNQRVVLRRLTDGAEVRAFQLRHAPWGRPLLAGSRMAVPTDGGLLGLELKTGDQQMLVETEPASAQRVAVAATDDGLIFLSGERTYSYMDIQSVLARLEEGRRRNPDQMQWLLRMAAVYEQQKRWSEAEKLIKLAMEDSGRQSADGSAEAVVVEARRQMSALYAAWAESMPEGEGTDRLQKWRQALLWSDATGARLRALLSVGRLARELGFADEAETAFRQVILLSGPQAVMLATGGDGVRRSAGALAAVELAEMGHPVSRGGGGVGDTGGALTAEHLGGLQINRLAMLSWAPGSRVLADSQDSQVPVIWARQDGLVAFGRRGVIVWMSSQAAGPDFEGWLLKDRLIERRGRQYITRDRRSGSVIGRWQDESRLARQPAEERRLAVGHVRRVVIIDGHVVEVVEHRDIGAGQSGEYLAPLVTDDGLLLPVVVGGLVNRLVMLDASTGKRRWSHDCTSLQGVFLAGDTGTGAGAGGGGVVTLTGEDGASTFTLQMLNLKDGAVRWRQDISGMRRFMFALAGKEWLAVGDQLTGRIAVVRFVAGQQPKLVYDKIVAQQRGTSRLRIVARTAEMTVLLHSAGLTAVNDRGETVWQLHGDLQTAFRGINVPQCFDEDGRTLAIATPHAVLCLDMTTAKMLWQHERELEAASSPRLLRVGEMLVAWASNAAEGDLAFLDRNTGKLLGRVSLGASALDVVVEPIAGGLMVINGNEILTITLPEQRMSRPLALLD